MNKRRLHHFWTKIRFVKPWYFLALAAVFAVVCVFALRANNEQMISLRDAVYKADQAGGNVEGPLKQLQAYVTSHMNTDLNAGPHPIYPPIQLKYTYDRLVQAQTEQVSQTNSQLYSSAQAYCEQQNHVDFSGRNRVPCIEQYVQSHSTVPLPKIPDDLYKFSFATPAWSPDLAGWTLLATLASFALFIVTLLARLWLKHQVN